MKNHFLYFTKAERFGIIGLLLLCAVLWIIPACLSEEIPPMEALAADVPIAAANSPSSNGFQASEEARELDLHPFDPNIVSAAELSNMGLPERTIRSWQNYLKKGGRFKKWKDIAGFRALSEHDRKRLKPYFRFPAEQPDSGKAQQAPIIALSHFDPNQLTEEALLKMGLPKRVAANWSNYLHAGGRFAVVEDIRKVYGLSEADFQRLKPFVQFLDPVAEWETRELVPEATLPSSYEENTTALVVDINQASVAEWQRLYGIGPAYSRRIVKFRDKLGGFHSVGQVAETYGLPDSVFQSILLQLRPSPLFRKLAINQLTVEGLAAHPYLRFQDARLIVNYREEHGAFNTIEDLDALYGLSEETKDKMKPYWDFRA